MQHKYYIYICIAVIALLMLGSFSIAQAAIRDTLNFQGKVQKADGTNVADQAYDFEFKIYQGTTLKWTETWTKSVTQDYLFTETGTITYTNDDVDCGGISGIDEIIYTTNTNEATLKAGQRLWNITKEESAMIYSVDATNNRICIYDPAAGTWASTDDITNRIYVKDGIFAVELNSLNLNWSNVDFSSDDLWLTVNFNNDGEMKPRKRLTMVPYSQNALNVIGSGLIDLDTATTGASAILSVAQTGDGKLVEIVAGEGDNLALDVTGTVAISEAALAIASKVADDLLFATYFNEGSLTGTRGQLATYTDADNIPTFELVVDTADKAPGGRGLLFTTLETLTYPTSGNIDADDGTISLWYSPDYASTEAGNKYLFQTANHLRIYYNGTDDKFYAEVYNGTDWTTVQALSAAQTFAADSWHHIVVTYDNDGSTPLALYVNNVQTTDISTWTAQALPTNMYVGSSSTPDQQAKGLISDFTIFNRVLTQQEVQQIYYLKQPIEDYAHTTTKYAKTVTVAKYGADYTTISDALTALSGSSTQPALILVMPGVYQEAITLEDYVDIISTGGPEVTTIQQATSTIVNAGASNARLEGFTISKTTDDAAVAISLLTYSPSLENLIITGAGTANQTAISITSGSPRIENVRISNVNTGITTATGSPIITNVKIGDPTQVAAGIKHTGASGITTVRFSTISSTTDDIYASGNGATIVSSNNILQSSTNNFETDTGATIESTSDKYALVDNDGTFRDLSHTRQYACGTGVAVGEVVYVSSADTVTEAKADSATTMPTIGVVVKKPTTTTCIVKPSGIYYDSAAPWTAGATYYVSAATAGAMTATKPVGELAQVIGVAKSTEELALVPDLTGGGASYDNVVTVSPKGGDYTTIQAAVNAIVDSSESNRYLILVYPGVYSEAVTINNKTYIDIVGVGGWEVAKVTQAAATVLTISGTSAFVRVEGLEFDVSADSRTGGSVVTVSSTALGVSLKDLKITWAADGGSGGIGISIASTLSTLALSINDVKITGAVTGIKQAGSGGTTTLTYSDITAAATGTDIDLDVGTINSAYNILRGPTNFNVAAATTLNSYKDTYNIIVNAGTFNQKDYVRNDTVTALTVQQSGTGNLVDLKVTLGTVLAIDDEGLWTVTPLSDTGVGLDISRNVASATNNIMNITESAATATGDVLQLSQAGKGFALDVATGSVQLAEAALAVASKVADDMLFRPMFDNKSLTGTRGQLPTFTRADATPAAVSSTYLGDADTITDMPADDVNTPRFEKVESGGAGGRGVWIEEARSNSALYTSFEAGTTPPTGWSYADSAATTHPTTVSSTYALHSSNSAKVIAASPAAGDYTYQVVTTTAASWTLSFYARMSDGSAVTDAKVRGIFNASAVTMTWTQVAGSAWYRGAYTATAPAAAANYGFQVQGTNTAYIDAFQLELGAFASTYIPTTAASVTRAAETLTYPTSGNLNASAGTMSLWFKPDFAYNSSAATFYLFSNDNTNKGAKLLYQGSDDTFHFQVGDGTNWTNVDAVSAVQAFSAGTWIQLVGTWETSAGAKLYVNTTQTSDATTFTAQTLATNFYIGSDSSSANQANSLISDFTIFNRTLTQQEVLQLYNLKQPIQDYAHTTTPYAKTVTVGKYGADYTTIAAALLAISGSSTDPALIQVMPGVYNEAITLEDYVDIISTGGPEVTTIQQATSTVVTAGASNTRLSGFTTNKTTDDTTAAISLLTYSPTLENLVITGAGTTNQIGITISTGSPNLDNLTLSTLKTGIQKTGANAAYLKYLKITATTDIDIDAGTIESSFNQFLGTTNFDIASGAIVYSYQDSFDSTKVTVASTGTFLRKDQPKNTVVVSKGYGGDYDTITEALNSFGTSCTSSNQCTIRVMPGTYTEQVTMKEYIDIIGSGWEVTEIKQTTATVVTTASNARLEGLTINKTTDDATAIISVGATSPTFNELNITGAGAVSQVAITISTGSPTFDSINISTCKTGIQKTGAGSFTLRYSTISATTDLDIDAGTLNSYFNKLSGTTNFDVAAGATLNTFKDSYSVVTNAGTFNQKDYDRNDALTALTINQAGTGNILDVQDAGTSVLKLDQYGRTTTGSSRIAAGQADDKTLVLENFNNQLSIINTQSLLNLDYSLGPNEADYYNAELTTGGGGKFGSEGLNNTIDASGEYLKYMTNQPVLDPNLVLDMKMDEGSGPTAADTSSYGNHGTLNFGTAGTNTSDAAMWDTGVIGNALEFDGVNDYVSVADAPSLDWSKITVEAWFQPKTIAEDGIISKGYDTKMEYGIYMSGAGKVTFYVDDNGDWPPVATVVSNTIMAADNWYHLVGTFDGAYLRIYVDGKLDKAPTAYAGAVLNSNDPIYIGSFIGASYEIHGLIDEVRIYNRALTSSEIAEHYQNTFWKYDASLKGYWRFNNASAGSAQVLGQAAIKAPDLSQYGNTGTVYNGVDRCEANWAPSANVTSTLDSDAADHREGSNSVRLDIADAFTTGLAAYHDITAVDLSSKTKASFWIKDSAAETANHLQLVLDEDAGCGSPSESLNIPALTANQWQYVEVNFAGASGDRDAIACVGLNVVTDTGAAVSVYLDDISSQRWVNGRYEEALSFDGVDDYVDCGNDVTPALNNYTIDLWFKTNVISETRYLASFLSLMALYIRNPGIISFYQAYDNLFASGYQYSSPSNTITANQWYHLVAIFRKDEGVWVYLNGNLLGSSTTKTGTTANVAGTFRIGVSYSGDSLFWDGLMDEVRIYNRALSAEEVKQHYYGNLHSNEGSIQMWVKPDGWNWSDASDHYFFDTEGLSIWKDGSALKFTIGGTTTSGTLSSSTDWKHISAAWENVNSGSANANIYLFDDGKELSSLTGQTINWTTMSDFWYVASDDATPSGNQADAIIDNLSISREIPDTKAEVAERIRAAYEIQKEQLAPSVQGSTLNILNIYQKAGETQTALTIRVDGTGDMLDIQGPETAAGAQSYFKVANNGTVSVKEDISLLGHTDLYTASDFAGLGNINDVYVYDTSKDSDGGKWTCDERAKASSWYNEALNTSTRGGTRCFPKKAVLVATNSYLYIFDAKDNSLWMRFDQSASDYMIGIDTNNDPSSVFALNGKIYLGENGSVATGLYAIDFIKDEARKYNATDDYIGNKKIGDRNSAISWTAGPSAPIVNITVNDVHAATISGKTYIGVATDGGVSVINETDERVLDYYYNATNYKEGDNVWLTSRGTLYRTTTYSTGDDAYIYVYYNIQNDTTDQTGGVQDVQYDRGTIPNIAPPGTSYIKEIYVTEGTSLIDGKSNTIYVASTLGLAVIQEKQGDESNGSVKYYTKDYITEEMVGDIRGMWPLAADDQSATTADALVKGETLTSVSMTTDSDVSGVRGKGLNFDGSADYLKQTPKTNYDSTNQDTDVELTNAATGNLAQGFQVSASTTVGTVRLWMKKIGTPTGNISIRIETDNAGVPSGSLVTNGASNTIDVSTLSTSYGWIGFKFATNPSLSASTQYHIVLQGDATYDGIYVAATTTAVWGVDGSSPTYASGTWATWSTTWTADATKDGIFELYNNNFDITGNLTVGAWVKLSEATSQDIIEKYDSTNNKGYILRTTASDYVQFTIGDGTDSQSATGSTALSQDAWHHLVGTYDGTNIKVYTDGVLTATQAQSAPADTSEPLYIGNLATGTIDEPFVTAEALSASQIKQMYEKGKRALEMHNTPDIDNDGSSDADTLQKLVGTENDVYAVAVDGLNRFIYVGSGNAEGGGVSKIGVDSDSRIDTWVTSGSKTDDTGDKYATNDPKAISVAESTQMSTDTNTDVHKILVIGTDTDLWIESGSSISLRDLVEEAVARYKELSSLTVKEQQTMEGASRLVFKDGEGDIERVVINSHGMTITPNAPTIKGSLTDATNLDNADGLYVSGKYAYVYGYTTTTGRVTLVDISNPASPVVEGTLSSATFNEGFSDIFVAGKYAYLPIYASTTPILSIVDVSNPNSPSIAGTASAASAMRAMSVYVSGRYAYVGISGGGIQVVDISNSSAPSVVGSLSSTAGTSVFASGKYLYSVGSGANIFQVIDISNPLSPTSVATLTDATNLAAATSVYVSGKYAYVAATSVDRLTIIDVSNPAVPAVVGSITDPIYLDGPQGVRSVTVSGRYAYFTSRLQNRLTIVDVSTPSLPSIIATLTDSTNLAGARNVVVSGRYAYITSFDNDRLTVIDISGIDIPAAHIGDLEVSTLTVNENVDVGGDIYIKNGIVVGTGGIQSQGPLSVSTPGVGGAFVVAEPVIEMNLPLHVNVGGNVGFAYDIEFTDPDLAKILSTGTLAIEAGTPGRLQDLKLKTRGTGNILADISNATSPAGFKILGSSGQVFSIEKTGESILDISAATTGLITKGSSAGSYVMKLTPKGNLTLAENLSQWGGMITVNQLDITEVDLPTLGVNADTGVTACTDATEYYYKVTALNDNGETTASYESHVNTGVASGATADDDTITVGWSLVPGTTKYRIFRETGQLIDNADAAWTAITADVTTSADTTDKKEGTGSAKAAIAAAFTTGQFEYKTITALNLASQKTIRLWIKSDLAVEAGDLKLYLDETACTATGAPSPDETISIPALSANTWEQVELNLSGTTTNYDAVICLAMNLGLDRGAQNVWIDDLNGTDNNDSWVDGAYTNSPTTTLTDNCTGDTASTFPPTQNTTGGKITVYRKSEDKGIIETKTAFGITEAVVKIGQPLEVNVGGDVGISYDLQFTSTGTSYITSAGPLTIQAGSPNTPHNLTLTTAGESPTTGGDVIVDVRYSNQTSGGLKVIGADSGGFVFKVSPSGDVEIGGTGSGGSDLTVKQNLTLTGGNITINKLSTPTNGVATCGTVASGGLADGTYYYRISAVNDNGETLAMAEFNSGACAAGAGLNKVTVSWDPAAGATGYKVYGRSTGAELYMKTISVPTNTYTDANTETPAGALPSANTTGGKWRENWQGDVVISNQSQTASATVTVSDKALAYRLTQNSGTTAANIIVTFNITGLSDIDGALAFISSQAQKGDTGATAYTTTVIVQINGTQVSEVTTGSATGAVIAKENYTIIRTDGTWRLAAGTTSSDSADIAEWFRFSGEEPVEGELVSIGNNLLTVIKSTQAYDEKIIGVVSANPYLAMGPEPAEGVKVALLGRVPTKVSLEAGPIVIGDYLVASSTPGVAMKATKAGRIIGQTLQSFEGVSTECEILITTNEEGEEVSSMNCYTVNSDIGKITVFVNPGWMGGEEVASSQISQAGVTIYDRVTGEAYCVYVEAGVLQTTPGACPQ